MMTDSHWILIVLTILSLFVDQSYSDCAGVIQCDCQYPQSAPGQPSLPIINCRSRGLTSVPTFNIGSDHYSQVSLAGNQIKVIKNLDFSMLTISYLDLSDNPIESVESQAFYGVGQSLKTLIIHFAPTATFPVAAFAFIPGVTVLEVSGFSGSSLPAGAIKQLSQLQEFRLINGQLAGITKDDLMEQRNSLETLNLSSNLISTSANIDTSLLTSLKSLIVSSNRITDLPANAFSGSMILESLDVSSNGLGSSINANAFQAINRTLKILRMTSTQMTDQSLQCLKSLQSITELYLSYNSISNVPAGLFVGIKTLRKLYLDNNKIGSLNKDMFQGLSSSLTTLCLGGNPMTNLAPDSFSSLSSLQELDLEGVPSLKLDVNIFTSQKSSLKILSLIQTGLDDQFWPAILPLSSMNTFEASKNSITQIPDNAFKGNGQLQMIDLSSNSITSVTPNSLNGLQSNLIALNLGNNKITAIDQCVFYLFRNFDFFQLGLNGNSLNCNCQLYWLYTTVKSANPSKFSTLSWQCSTPNKPFAYMNDADFGCTSNTTQKTCQTLEVPPSEQPQPLILTIVNITDTSAQLAWTVKGAGNIENFRITLQEQSQQDTTTSSMDVGVVAGSLRMHIVTGLLPSTTYQFCVNMTVISSWNLPKQSCATAKTLDSTSKGTGGSNQDLAIILGSVLGGVAFIVVVIIICIVLQRKNQKQKERERAYRKPKDADRPTDLQISSISGGNLRESRADAAHMGYGSRRYVKNPRSRSNSPRNRDSGSEIKPPDNGTTKLQTFSPDEQDRILQLLLTAPMSRHKSQSSTSVGSAPRYVTHPGAAPSSPLAGHGGVLTTPGLDNSRGRGGYNYYENERSPNRQRSSNVYSEIHNGGYEDDNVHDPYTTTV